MIVPLKGPTGRATGYLSVHLDITAAVESHVALDERTRLLHNVLDNFPGGIAVYDKSLRMVICNDRQKELLEYPEHLFAKGSPTL
ncbi:PAS-domain containing protein, partial [Staphylococcus aureus]